MAPTDYGSTRLGGAVPRDGRPPRGVVAVLLEDERFLLIKRGPRVRAAGWWCFPGGALDPGEGETDALVREIREELGIAVEPLQPLWRAVTGWGVDLAWWQVAWRRAPGNERMVLEPSEIAEAAWFRREEAVALPDLLGSNLAFFQHEIDRQIR